MILPFFHQPYVCTYYHHKLSNQHHVAWPRHLFFLYVDHKFLIFYQFLDYILLGFLNHYTDLYTDALYFCNLLLVSESSHFSVLLGIRVISASPIHFTQNQYFFSQVSIILANVVYYWTRSFIMFTFHLFLLYFRAREYEVNGKCFYDLGSEWFTVTTAITQSPQPSTLLSIPRLDVHGTPTFSSPISTATTPWWTTTPEKECCTPGTTGVW